MAQMRWANANKAKLKRQGFDVDEWNAASKGMKLPERSGAGNLPRKKPKTK